MIGDTSHYLTKLSCWVEQPTTVGSGKLFVYFIFTIMSSVERVPDEVEKIPSSGRI